MEPTRSTDPFCFCRGPKRSKRVTKGFVSSTYYYRSATNCFTTSDSWVGPAGSSGDPFCSCWGPKRSKRVTKKSVSSTYYYRCYLLLLLLIALLPRFHGTYQIYLDRAVWAGWKLWRPFLFLLGPKTVKKGHQRVCQQYLLLPLLLLLLIALLQRFHGTYQIYLDRAVWAGWQLCYYCD